MYGLDLSKAHSFRRMCVDEQFYEEARLRRTFIVKPYFAGAETYQNFEPPKRDGISSTFSSPITAQLYQLPFLDHFRQQHGQSVKDRFDGCCQFIYVL
jgi:hypothetical protein